MPKNVQTTAQLHTSNMLAKEAENSPSEASNSTRTENFWMFKMNLEKAEKPEIKLPTSVDSSKKSKKVPEKILTSALLTMPKPDVEAETLILWPPNVKS